jgi:hypothetical protein
LANPAQIVGQPILAAAGFQRLLKKAKARLAADEHR